MKKVLITGCMRSGTTFLTNFLNSQNHCLIYRDFLVSIFRTSQRLGIKSFLTVLDDEQKNILLSQLKAESYVMGSNRMDGLSKDFSNLKELYNNALQIMGEKNDCEVVGSKVTVVGNWLPKVINETDIYVIYIYRDVRDTLLSAKNMFADYNLSRLLIEWENDLEIALRIESERFLIVKFEDLILNTEPIIENLSDFLGVEILKDMKSGKDRETDWLDNSAFNDLNQMFDRKACFRWMDHKDSKEVKYCEILMSDLIKRLGYNVNKSAYSTLNKSSAYKDFYIQKFKNLGIRTLSNFR